jgi:hypothetical protein
MAPTSWMYDNNEIFLFICIFTYTCLDMYICLLMIGDEFIRVAQHPFIQGLRFGPDEADFTMNLPTIFPFNAGKARHAFKNQFADYYALRTKMAKLELSSALTPEAVAKDKVYLTGISKVKSSSEHILSLFKKKDEIEENILSDGLQADVSLYLLNKRTYQATRRRAFTILPGMTSPHRIDGRYKCI